MGCGKTPTLEPGENGTSGILRKKMAKKKEKSLRGRRRDEQLAAPEKS